MKASKITEKIIMFFATSILLWTPALFSADFDEEVWQELKKNGYVFVESPEFICAYESLEKSVSQGIFDQRVETNDPLLRFHKNEDFFGQKDRVQRDSWFLSQEKVGPFEADQIKNTFDAARNIWRGVESKLKEENPCYDYTNSEAIGLHRYLGDDKGEGLPEHYDIGLISILYSNKPLEGKVNGKWQVLAIPKGHVMIFLGKSAELMSSDIKSLLHRVPHVEDYKLSLGVFITPDPSSRLIVDGEVSETSVGELIGAYFSKDKSSYQNLLRKLGRDPEISY